MSSRVTMSALAALAKVYEVQLAQNSLTFEESCKVAKESSADSFALDYEGALFLKQFDTSGLEHIWSEEWIRGILRSFLLSDWRIWHKSILKGRGHVLRQLTDNERQVFEAAGLCSENPESSVISWWDAFQDLKRSELDQNDFRDWEAKSLEYEIKRLQQLKCPNRPTWRSIDDNTCGFDIESFDILENEWISIAIEVKSRYTQDILFEMSRNECDQMARMKNRYRVHFWSKPEGKLNFVDSEALINTLPKDSESARWKSSEFHFQAGMFPAL